MIYGKHITFKQKEIGKQVFSQYQSPEWGSRGENLHMTLYYEDAPFVVGQDTTISIQLRHPL